MSIKYVHILFVTVATLMSLCCALLFFGYYRASEVSLWLWTGIFMLAATVGLPVYGYCFIRKLNKNGIHL